MLDNVGQLTTEQAVKASLPDRQDDEVVSCRRPVRKAELPEWAQLKICTSTVLCNFTVLIQRVSMSPIISFQFLISVLIHV